MKITLLTLLLLSSFHFGFCQVDSVTIPFDRQYFHDKIVNQQTLADEADGLKDGQFTATKNNDVNLQLTDALYRRIKDLRYGVEVNALLPGKNEKIRYLSYIEELVRSFRMAWKSREISPVEFPALITAFEKVAKAQLAGASILPHLHSETYGVAKILARIFYQNAEAASANNIVYLKYVALHPDKILLTLRPFANETFADSLIVVASKNDPVQLYSFAQNKNSPQGKLIQNSADPLVMTIAKLSNTPNALLYFPFLDDLFNGKKKIEDISVFAEGSDGKGYDSVGYFGLLAKTETEYYKRMAPPNRDTPIAMFGPNGLREMLHYKANQHFITPINALHELTNVAVRMRSIEPLTPSELYYVMVMGENDIYTSSYKHAFARLLQQMGKDPRGDSLLLTVNFDYFKKFIKMAANYNKLDTFLSTMPPQYAALLMKAFVANLDQGQNLEDAVDVADSYSSITNKVLQKNILSYVIENEETAIKNNNTRGKVIYSLLRNIFLSADSSNAIDLTTTLGIPSIYEVSNAIMQDQNGRIVQQVFFYGDEDGKTFFPPFVNSFSAAKWNVTYKKEWVEITSKKGNVFVFANRPLDYDANLDDSAQVHLISYLESKQMQPSIVVHRGHSYWLKGTIDRMPANAKIVVLGSCGGYKNLSQILDVSPDAHIISTKEIGAGDINRPILNYLNQNLAAGKTVAWKDMWASLTKIFSTDPSKAIRESWEDYVPPYKNLGAIFIKAYNMQMQTEVAALVQ